MSLGRRIKILRKEQQMTQEALGRILNVGKSTISQYENNINTPDPETLQKIADFFGVSVDYLLGRTKLRQSNKINEALKGNPELQEFWDKLIEREDLKLLMSQVKDADPESIRKLIKIIKLIEDKEENED